VKKKLYNNYNITKLKVYLGKIHYIIIFYYKNIIYALIQKVIQLSFSFFTNLKILENWFEFKLINNYYLI
jgi:hypothetical protein